MTAGEPLIDTNVLVHAYLLLDAKQHDAAKDVILPIWENGGGLTSQQNLSEFFVVATKVTDHPMPASVAGSLISEILAFERWSVIDRGPTTIIRALEFVKLHGIHFWDALIAATMLEHGVRTIVTENERDFRKIPGLKVVNPFK